MDGQTGHAVQLDEEQGSAGGRWEAADGDPLLALDYALDFLKMSRDASEAA